MSAFDGIKVVECPWLEPGKFFMINETAFEPISFKIEEPKRRIDDMRDALCYATMTCYAPIVTEQCMIGIDWADPPRKQWKPFKYRGPRRRSIRRHR